MPRRNRVSPTGEFFADPARGTLMGNRGILHDAAGRLGPSRWKHHAWIACVLAFKNRPPRPLMAPGRYTELFFLDEATALAAGHRPCAECRRAAFVAYREAFFRPRPREPERTASRLDALLHADRIIAGTRVQKTFPARLGDLPDGTFVQLDGHPHLVLGARCLRWTPGSYEAARERPDDDAMVTVLTPGLSVDALARGYRAAVHPSAAQFASG